MGWPGKATRPYRIFAKSTWNQTCGASSRLTQGWWANRFPRTATLPVRRLAKGAALRLRDAVAGAEDQSLDEGVRPGACARPSGGPGWHTPRQWSGSIREGGREGGWRAPESCTELGLEPSEPPEQGPLPEVISIVRRVREQQRQEEEP